ncbi:hypothetical protein [Algibacter sp. 2305UL17-15]|uniref:hypothetical protein n=1 Tax=Algibacter sp. 2305UL17-15 TaxID=3231268 RepID=UPI003457D9D3
MNKLKYILGCILFVCSCATDTDDNLMITLDSYTSNKTIEKGGVIACAASDKDTGEILTFYYPEEGATNIRFYETENAQVNHEEYSNYKQMFPKSDPFFNGYLGKFTQSSTHEKWIIVTFELDGEIKISNPIRSKHISKPTVWTDAVTIDQSISGMPNFTWEANAIGGNAIYFQVISDAQDNLLSGTYTYDSHFQYYNTSNVVLNITTKTPPPLIQTEDYNFTLMDVSLDNWVNWVVLKSFEAQ